MLETPHAALGAAIAVKIGNPLIALPLAFLSHFPLETLPHWNPHIYTEVKTNGKLSNGTLAVIWLDVATSLGVGFWIAYQAIPDIKKAAIIIAACFFAVLPDLIESPYFIFGLRHPLLEKLINFQRRFQTNVSVVPGLLFQALVFIFLLNLATH
jgi:hypothetical protein